MSHESGANTGWRRGVEMISFACSFGSEGEDKGVVMTAGKDLVWFVRLADISVRH